MVYLHSFGQAQNNVLSFAPVCVFPEYTFKTAAWKQESRVTRSVLVLDAHTVWVVHDDVEPRIWA